MGVRWVGGLVDGVFEVGDALVGCGELVFEADDAEGRGEGHVLIEQGTDPLGEGELGAAVAALAADGASGGEESGGVEAAQKGWLHAKQFGGQGHGVGGVVLVVEFVVDAPWWAHPASG